MAEAKKQYFGEEGYRNWMRDEVEPFLKKCREYGYFHSYDGTAVFYNKYRFRDAGRCVVILHGFCEFAEKYHEFIYYILREGYSVYIPEHRGQGYSDRRISDMEMVYVHDFGEYVEDLRCFMQKIVDPKESRKVLFGHSMGGTIGTLFLERYAGEFEAAVLSSPMFRMRTGKCPAALAEAVAEFYCLTGRAKKYAPGQGGFRETPDFEGSSCLSKERYLYVYEKRLENPKYRTSGASCAWVRAGLAAERRLMKKRNLCRIDVPILLFAAGCDSMVDNRALEKFAKHTKRRKRTKLIFMPESKHEIFHAGEMTRRQYYEQIAAFLTDTEEYNENKT